MHFRNLQDNLKLWYNTRFKIADIESDLFTYCIKNDVYLFLPEYYKSICAFFSGLQIGELEKQQQQTRIYRPAQALIFSYIAHYFRMRLKPGNLSILLRIIKKFWF